MKLPRIGRLTVSAPLLCLALAAGSNGQATAPQQGPPTQEDTTSAYKSPAVLRATTRLVVVDVVATDSKGHPVPDLGIDDFTILEDDKPQKISGFTFRQSTALSEVRRTTNLNLFTNAPRYAGASSLNVILLDSLNAEYLSRTYGRDQLLKYLESEPSIQPTAIYALEDTLKLLHDFTTDAKELKAVLEAYKPHAPTRVVDVYSAASPFSRRGDFTTNSHTLEATVSALGALAQILAGHPGRKNLIWVSAAFPLTIYPETYGNNSNPIDLKPGDATAEPSMRDIVNQNNLSGNARSFSDEIEHVANAMMNAQVAIYPVDCSGVAQNSRASAAATMRILADRTGGKTYINRNDVDMGVRSSMDDGATYYTLEYYPQNKSWDGKFRLIQVKTNQAGTTLRYRQGYYALNPGEQQKKKDSENDLARRLSDALSPDMPASTGIIFQAGVVPPAGKSPVTVNFAIDAHTLAFDRRADGLAHASLSCAVVAYSDKGSVVKKEINSITAALKTEQFEKVMQGYFPCQRTIELKSGHYKLTLGVVDERSGLIGTTTASVTVP